MVVIKVKSQRSLLQLRVASAVVEVGKRQLLSTIKNKYINLKVNSIKNWTRSRIKTSVYALWSSARSSYLLDSASRLTSVIKLKGFTRQVKELGSKTNLG